MPIQFGSPLSPDEASVNADMEKETLGKITKRLIPLLFLLYIAAYLDRVNVGFAALQMKGDLSLSDATYGLGAGIFFLGYFLFEVPSNLALEKVGARLWIARIMISWGLISSAMMFAKGPLSFYALRFLLGAAEAGFFPGIILYLTYWYPAKARAKAVASFMTATALAGVVGGPVSGALLNLNGALGLAGWQWLFLLEGLPSVLLGLAVLKLLPDGPKHATWLSPKEITWLNGRLRQENKKKPHQVHTLRKALSSPRIWQLSLLYFFIIIGLYGYGFWLPQIVKAAFQLDNLSTGFVTAIPYLLAAWTMTQVANHSDKTEERRLHVAIPCLVAALGLTLAAAFSSISPLASFYFLLFGAAGIWSALGPFWSLPTAFLSGTAAAGGIAFVNSLGNLGGFAGPSLMGWIKARSEGYSGALGLLALSLGLAGLLALALPRLELKS